MVYLKCLSVQKIYSFFKNLFLKTEIGRVSYTIYKNKLKMD